MLQDIAIVTGADFISEDLGKKLDSVEISQLGIAGGVISTKDNTTIVGGKGKKEDIDNRIAQLKTQIKKSDMEFDREKLQERLGKLSGGVAVIKVGAPTESAQKELKQRVEDAVAATRAAMEEGIVPGGGIALFNVVGLEAKDIPEHMQDLTSAAKQILTRALEAPIRAIIMNSGENPDSILRKLRDRKEADRWTGFNASSNKIENLKEAGIVDPLKVVKTSFMNAISVASTYLTIGAAVTDIPKKDNAPAGGGMPGMDY